MPDKKTTQTFTGYVPGGQSAERTIGYFSVPCYRTVRPMLWKMKVGGNKLVRITVIYEEI